MKLPKRGRNEPPGTNLRSGGFIFLVSRIEKTAGSFGVSSFNLNDGDDDIDGCKVYLQITLLHHDITFILI